MGLTMGQEDPTHETANDGMGKIVRIGLDAGRGAATRPFFIISPHSRIVTVQ